MPKPEYIEYLKANGASAEDIAALTEGTSAVSAIKTFDAMQARITAESTAAAAKAREDADRIWNTWYDEKVKKEFEDMANQEALARGEAAKARAVIETLRRQGSSGLDVIAKNMGYDLPTGGDGNDPNPPNPTPGAPPAFDPKKFVSTDDAVRLMEAEGDAIALVQDIAAEHAALFPSQRLNMRELRVEAKQRKQTLEQVWMNKYKVNDARAAAVAADQKKHDDAIRDEARKTIEAEYAARGGSNPDLRLPVTSHNPFAPRPDRGRDKMPWERGENVATADRVARGTENLIKDVTGARRAN